MHHADPALKAVIEACDRAISQEDYDTLMSYYAEDAALVVKPGMVVRGKENIRKAFIAIADYFQHRLVVTQGKMEVIEGGGNALVIMETRLDIPTSDGISQLRDAPPMSFRSRANAGCAPSITPTAPTCLMIKCPPTAKVFFAEDAGGKVTIAAIADNRHHHRARIFAGYA